MTLNNDGILSVTLNWGGRFRLRLRYGSLGAEDYQELLTSILQEGGGKDAADLRRLLLMYVMSMRPSFSDNPVCQPDDMRWKHWVALALRYLPALVEGPYGTAKPSTVANVRDRIEHDRELVQAFLFGNRQLILDILDEGFDGESWRGTLPDESAEQALILDIVRYHLSSTGLSERQVGNWTKVLLDEWVEELQQALQVPLLRYFSEVTQTILGRLSGTDNPTDPAMFKVYLARFQEAELTWAYGQALGYHNELKHRFRQASRLAPWVAAGGIGAAVALMIAIVTRLFNGPFLFQVLFVSLTGFGLVVVLFNLARISLLILGIAGRVEAQVQTLEQIAATYLDK
jgi:hypothetical protein